MKFNLPIKKIELASAGAELPAAWAGNTALKWSARLLLVWVCGTLVAPANLLACACSEMAIGSAVVRSNLNVDSKTGVLNVTQGDIELPGIIPINLTRIYNGGDLTYTPFGRSWSIAGLSFLKMSDSYTECDISMAGQLTHFVLGETYDKGETKKITLLADNVLKMEDAQGNEWRYSMVSGYLLYYVDANGNRIDYTWKTATKILSDGNPLNIICPLTITYPDSRQITFTYSTTTGEEYLCTQATSPSGFTVGYTYTNGLLTGISKSNSQYLNYSYTNGQSNGNDVPFLSHITYASGAVVNVLWVGYDEPQQGADTHKKKYQVSAVSGPNGYVHTFNFSGILPKAGGESTTETSTAMVDSNGKLTRYVYGAEASAPNVHIISESTVFDALNASSGTTKNEKNRMTAVTNKRGKVTHFEYNEADTNPLLRDKRTKVINPLGKLTVMDYDGAGNLTKITDPLSRDTEMEYDSHHNLTKLKNGLGQTVEAMSYTTKGLLATTKDGRNNETSYTYNSKGFRTKTTDALSKEWNYTYDTAGNQLTSQSPLGRTTTLTYNGFYKPATVEDPLGNETGFTYDDMANLTKVTDALGRETITTYDLLQRVTKVTDASGNETSFSYDGETNLTKLTDALGREYSYTFDAINQIKTFVFPGGTSESYDYDANGNLTKSTDRSGVETTYVYDDADRMTTKTWEGGPDKVFAYSYNDANQMTAISEDGTAKASYTYDGAMRLTGMTVDGRAVGYGYDASQNLNEVSYPSTTVAGYLYDARNQLSLLKRDGSIIAAYTYDDDGRLTKRELGNGLEQVYTYDAASRLTQTTIREIATPTNIKQQFTYGYDTVGNRTYTKYLGGRGDVYQYDATYQVTEVKYDVTDPTVAYASATGAARTVTYAYDAVGNRTSVIDGAATTTYVKNSLNQYTAVGATNYTYSTRGELTGDGTWAYTYDHEKRLIGASKSGVTATYAYDVLGRRSSKTVNGVTTNYVYSAQNLIEERDGSGAVTKRYVYEGGLDRPVQVVIGSSVYYFTQDVLGNVTALTDASGVMVESYTYDVFGKPVIKDGSGTVITTALTPFLFTGREFDAETGLYHYRARAYHTDLGRFLQADPIGFLGSDTNLYRYVKNGVVDKLDPFGTTDINVNGDVWRTPSKSDFDHVHSLGGVDQGPHMHGPGGAKFFPKTGAILDGKGKWTRASNKFMKQMDKAMRSKLGKGLGAAGILLLLGVMVNSANGQTCEQIENLRAQLEKFQKTGDLATAGNIANSAHELFGNDTVAIKVYSDILEEN